MMRCDGESRRTLRSRVGIHVYHQAARTVEPSVTDTAAVAAVVVGRALVGG